MADVVPFSAHFDRFSRPWYDKCRTLAAGRTTIRDIRTTDPTERYDFAGVSARRTD